MRKIAIANQKGGVGKTTTAVNLAVALARIGKKVLVVDLDPQGNATFAFLGLQIPNATAIDMLLGGRSAKDVIVPTGEERVDLLPSDIDLASAEVKLIAEVGGQTRLNVRLGAITQKYDFVIVDTPPSLGVLTINSLAAVDEVIVPVSASVFALKGMAQLEKTVEEVQSALGSNVRISGVLITMFDNTRIAKDVLENVQGRYRDTAFKTIIPKSVKLEEAHSRRKNIFTHAPENKAAEAYANLAKEVIKRGK